MTPEMTQVVEKLSDLSVREILLNVVKKGKVTPSQARLWPRGG
jgi:hypothetical protein